MRISLLLLSLFLVSCFAQTLDSDQATFEQYKTLFKRNYVSEEENDRRFLQFQKSLREIESLNAIHGENSYITTDFADRFDHELPWDPNFNVYPLVESASNKAIEKPIHFADDTNAPTPTTWNWCDHNLCTPVRDQGKCFAAHAMAAADTISALQAKMDMHPPKNISAQAILDCMRSSRSCCGDLISNVLSRVSSYYKEEEYPFTSQGQSETNCTVHICHAGLAHVAQINGFQAVNLEWTDMIKWLHSFGPIVAGMYIPSAMKHYGPQSPPIDGGKECENATRFHNHYVQVVGYGVQGVPYYLCKNNWGANWGDKGYFKIRADNPCGIGQQTGGDHRFSNTFTVHIGAPLPTPTAEPSPHHTPPKDPDWAIGLFIIAIVGLTVVVTFIIACLVRRHRKKAKAKLGYAAMGIDREFYT
eukprot:gnl/Trimastix_PCT/2527.p1 GENE.gnl/Trimastix_PCT/2527~~gnl/Trimastix_PCT/2527.p1  ORF type:complete len:417 (+),score=78.28 gnl/Trimastix_PCT/2527:84-1334(+)